MQPALVKSALGTAMFLLSINGAEPKQFNREGCQSQLLGLWRNNEEGQNQQRGPFKVEISPVRNAVSMFNAEPILTVEKKIQQDSWTTPSQDCPYSIINELGGIHNAGLFDGGQKTFVLVTGNSPESMKVTSPASQKLIREFFFSLESLESLESSGSPESPEYSKSMSSPSDASVSLGNKTSSIFKRLLFSAQGRGADPSEYALVYGTAQKNHLLRPPNDGERVFSRDRSYYREPRGEEVWVFDANTHERIPDGKRLLHLGFMFSVSALGLVYGAAQKNRSLRQSNNRERVFSRDRSCYLQPMGEEVWVFDAKTHERIRDGKPVPLGPGLSSGGIFGDKADEECCTLQ
jgi:hypothetical protein